MGAKHIYCKGTAVSPKILIENSANSSRCSGNHYDLVGYTFPEDYSDFKNKPIPVQIKNDTETEYGNDDVNIAPADIGFGNVQSASTNDQTPMIT